MRRRVTFSRNFTLSLSRTCQCYCKYCAFKTHKAHLYSPEEVEALLEQAVRRHAKELLVPQGSATEHPGRRLEAMRWAGELAIPFTSGILGGIGESEAERLAALDTLTEVQAEFGHIQEVILQNFVPHDSYYGQEPAEI